MLEVRSIEYIDPVEWRKLLAISPTASYFQSPEYYDFCRSLSFLQPIGFGVFHNNELKGLVCGYTIANGGLVKRFFSRRAVIHGGLLLAENTADREVEELLLALKKSLAKRVIYIEIRNSGNFSVYKDLFEKNGFIYQSHLNYLVDTTQLDSLKTRYSESKARQIRKSRQQRVVCELTKNQKDIDEFYRILHNLYRKKIKKPLFPKEFFEKMVEQPGCYLFVVKKDEKVIGGIACASLAEKAVYEWFVCGDTKNHKHAYPSVLATHTGIEFAAKNGFPCFDFMGAGKPDEAYGVRDFKEKFGGELYEWGRFRYVINKPLFNIGKFVVETIKDI